MVVGLWTEKPCEGTALPLAAHGVWGEELAEMALSAVSSALQVTRS